MKDIKRDPKDKWILIYFLMFFGVVFAVNGVFIYLALDTHTGVIVDKPYEKGLAFNQTLDKAKSQPVMNDIVSYQEGRLIWEIKDKNNRPIDDALVSAHIVRPVQDGYDFDVTFKRVGMGTYEAYIDLPLQGQWHAQLDATWNNTRYQTRYSFLKE